MKLLSIGEVARKSGIRTSALRYYEEAGILPAPARINGRRCYEPDALRRIDVLRFAQQAGFTLDEIKTLFRGFGAETPLSARWQSLARAKLRELDVLAKRVKRMRRALEIALECGCVRIEDCSLSPDDIPNEPVRRSKSEKGCSC
jgi:MerR family redox-sensitive transcriptional activator SoxR